jgi:hypothetical protein
MFLKRSVWITHPYSHITMKASNKYLSGYGANISAATSKPGDQRHYRLMHDNARRPPSSRHEIIRNNRTITYIIFGLKLSFHKNHKKIIKILGTLTCSQQHIRNCIALITTFDFSLISNCKCIAWRAASRYTVCLEWFPDTRESLKTMYGL